MCSVALECAFDTNKLPNRNDAFEKCHFAVFSGHSVPNNNIVGLFVFPQLDTVWPKLGVSQYHRAHYVLDRVSLFDCRSGFSSRQR